MCLRTAPPECENPRMKLRHLVGLIVILIATL
jgi:hypothetical protein